MPLLFESLSQFFEAGINVLFSLIELLLPWTALAAWLIFWLLGVNWVKLRDVLLKGAWVGVLLIGFLMILIWGLIAPPEGGYHYLLTLKLSNFVGKTVYVTSLFCMMFLCGSVQLSGLCSKYCDFEPEEELSQHSAH